MLVVILLQIYTNSTSNIIIILLLLQFINYMFSKQNVSAPDICIVNCGNSSINNILIEC